MEHLPLVSVGIPTYNRPKGLKRTLDSICTQTYPNLQIIVSDNCSTDNSVKAILEEYSNKDKRIESYVQEENRGAIYNFNFVLEKAKGEYFMWLADDDWLDTNCVERCVHFLILNMDYCSAYCLGKYYNQDGIFLHFDTFTFLENSSYSKRILMYLQSVRYNSVFYGLKRISDKDKYKAKPLLADDWMIVSRLLFSGKIKCIQDANLHISAGGASNDVSNMIPELHIKGFFSKNFIGLTVSKNVASDILKSEIYSIPTIRKIVLACQVFIISYTNTIMWDLISIKRFFLSIILKRDRFRL